MKHIISKSLLIILILGIFSCTANNTDNREATKEKTVAEEVIVYGSNSCDHCIDFKAKLDNAGIDYVFHDVEQNQQLADEMVAAVQSINYQGYIAFPVVVVDTQVFVNPPFADVLKVIRK